MIFLSIGISAKIEERGVAVYQHGPILRPSLFNLPVIGTGGYMVFNQIELPLSNSKAKQNRFGKRIKKNFRQWELDRMLKQRQERMIDQSRTLKGWLL
jgi:hypothetical protein